MAGGMKVLLLTVLVSLGVAATACGGDRESSRGEGGCGETVLDDWADGRVDGIYPSSCYLAAIELLPEDVRAYSSAIDDLSRALQARRTGEGPRDPGRTLAVSGSAAGDGSEGLRDAPAALLLLGGAGALVALGGGVAFALRRAGGRR